MSCGYEIVAASEFVKQIGCFVAFAAIIGIFGFGYVGYRIGYDQGRNDGFKAGWREAMQAKEITRTTSGG